MIGPLEQQENCGWPLVQNLFCFRRSYSVALLQLIFQKEELSRLFVFRRELHYFSAFRQNVSQTILSKAIITENKGRLALLSNTETAVYLYYGPKQEKPNCLKLRKLKPD